MSAHDGVRPETDPLDRAPSDTVAPEGDVWDGVRVYSIGLALAIALTIASFWAARTHLIYGPAVPVAIAVLAFAQMGIHLVFFLHITTGPDNTNNVLALAFGVLVAVLIIFGSVWIMANMNRNMHMDHGPHTQAVPIGSAPAPG
jgi:cytochrome o ubiquinol oxidase operon protein cyoD